MERDPLDIAWAAGLFEGEGCLTIAVEANRHGKRHVGARLGSTDLDVVERFARIIGFGHVNRKRPPSAPEHWKTLWEWSAQSAPRVRDLIDLLRPYLGERRLARAEEVYAAALLIKPLGDDLTHCPHGHPYEGDNVQIEKRAAGPVRRCRTCRRGDARRWEAKQRTA